MVSSKKLIKSCLASIIWRGRIKTILFRVFGTRNEPIIIYYHRVCEKENGVSSRDIIVMKSSFEKQIEFLKNSFNILPLHTITDRMKKGGKGFSNDMAITFDDGYIDNYSYAYPILKKFGLPATVFLPTEYIGTNRLFWWDELTAIVNSLRGKEVDWSALFSKKFPDQFKALLKKAVRSGGTLTPLTDYLKSVGKKGREQTLEYLRETFVNESGLENRPRVFLSWDEIKEMSDNGIEFGSHSHSHAVLTEINDEELARELSVSKNLIREYIGKEANGFSYPDGIFDERVRKKVIEAGYDYAVQTFRIPYKGLLDPYSIPRKMVKEGHSKGCFGNFSEALFSFELSGWADSLFLRNMRKRNPYEH